MAYDNLADFLSDLEDDRDLLRVSEAVDPIVEASAVVAALCGRERPAPAVLFDRLKGSPYPAVFHLLGSARRVRRALGIEAFEELGERIADLIAPDVPSGWLESLQLIPRFGQLLNVPPQIVRNGPCQQVVRLGTDVNLHDLPIAQHWPRESGPSITSGVCISAHPRTGIRNLGVYPLEVRSRNTLAVHWTLHDEARAHFEQYRQSGQPMPLAVAIGGDPILRIAAQAPLPANVDEFLFAGFLRNESVSIVSCRTHDLHVPAQAELVIEGQLDVSAAGEPAGPLATETGYYDAAGTCPILHVSAITQRANPVYVTSIPGPEFDEWYWIDQALQHAFLPLVRLMVPEIVELHLPRAGVGRNYVFVSIRKHFPHQARKVMQAIWGLQRLMFAKFVVVVDDDVNVRDEEAVWFAVASHVHPGRDVAFSDGPAHAHDHATPQPACGQRMGLDATRKTAAENPGRTCPERMQFGNELLAQAERHLQSAAQQASATSRATDDER